MKTASPHAMAIERRPLQSEAMGLWFGAAANWRYEANFSEKGKCRAKHQTRIEAIRLCASLFRAHLSINIVSADFQ